MNAALIGMANPAPVITDTGMKGFLKWLQWDSPGLYQRAAPLIAQRVPEAFSTYEQSRKYRLAGLSDTTQSSPGLVDLSFDTDQLDVTPGVQQSVTDSSDVSDVANSGSVGPQTTSAISNILSSIVDAFQAKQNADVQKTAIAGQLQLAQAGLNPSAISTRTLGIPGIPTLSSVSSSSMLMWGGLAVLGFMVFGVTRRRK